MNFNKDLWDTTEAKEFGEYETLELGGHEVTILDVREYTSDISGNTSLKVSVDVSGTDKQAGFFKKQFDENTAEDKKWPSGAVKYLSLKDEQIAYLKGFITAVENSNKGFKFNKAGEWNQLKGKKIAGVFGLEEYTKQDGTVGAATKLIQFRSLDKLSEIQVPRVRLLNGTLVNFEDYKPSESGSNLQKMADDLFGSSTVEIGDDMLPF